MDAGSTVRDDFVQLWGSLGTFWGVSPTTAKVFGWLFSRREPADANHWFGCQLLEASHIVFLGAFIFEPRGA